MDPKTNKSPNKNTSKRPLGSPGIESEPKKPVQTAKSRAEAAAAAQNELLATRDNSNADSHIQTEEEISDKLKEIRMESSHETQ